MLNVFFNGRLGADCEVKTSKSGNKYLSMNVATDDFDNGERITLWTTVNYAGGDAEKRAQYLKKGSHIQVIGKLSERVYQAKSGEYAIGRSVFADRLEFVSNGNSGSTKTQKVEETKDAPFGDTGTFTSQSIPLGNQGDEKDDLPF